MSELNVGNLNVGSELNLPIYAESNLPASPPVGHMVFNSTQGKIAVWDGSKWVAIGSKQYEITPGGSNYTVNNLTGDLAGYKVIKFTGNGSFTVNSAPTDSGVEILIIAGGGGGGGVIGGGGGAGGVIYKRSVYLPAGTYSVTVGNGGGGGLGWNNIDQEGRAGQPSIISGGNVFYEAIGGGGGCGHGGSTTAQAGSGGSGGGSANLGRQGGVAIGTMGGNLNNHLKSDHVMGVPSSISGDAWANSNIVGTASAVNYTGGVWWDNSASDTGPATLNGWQGYPGGDWGDGNMGAGGGGAGQCGQNAGVPLNRGGDGGHGIYCEIEGVKKSYAGGGGGGVRDTSRIRGIGGIGGGGNGGADSLSPTPYSSPSSNAASNGQNNTGGGGGGGGYNGSSSAVIGGNGGPGVVIIKYKAS